MIELEGSYFDNTSLVVNMPLTENSSLPPPITGSVTLQIEQWERRLSNFSLHPPQVRYHNRLPERSQSFVSVTTYNELQCSMTNKLEAQQGTVHVMRKHSRPEDAIRLSDTLKKRRSRSVDSHFSQGTSSRGAAEIHERTNDEASRRPSTSRGYRQSQSLISQPVPVPNVEIQINGKGMKI